MIHSGCRTQRNQARGTLGVSTLLEAAVVPEGDMEVVGGGRVTKVIHHTAL